MNIDFPKETCWDCPEGGHTIRLSTIQSLDRHITGKATDELRFVWEVVSIDDARFSYQVGKRYSCTGERGSELREDLKNWLGDELFNYVGPDRKLDSDKLIGLLADGWVVHIPNKRYAKPFVYLKNIAPKGTFTSNGDN